VTAGENRRIRAETANPNCAFDSYEILEFSGDGSSVRATLRVYYTVYKVPGQPMERRTIAVLDFPMEEVHLYGVGGGREQRIDGVEQLGSSTLLSYPAQG